MRWSGDVGYWVSGARALGWGGKVGGMNCWIMQRGGVRVDDERMHIARILTP